ncbi:MAG: NADH-quinone oxidoreductase subunit M [Aeromicrobium sp.]
MIVAALLLPAVVGLLLMIGRRFVPGRTAAWTGAATMAVSLALYALIWAGRDVDRYYAGHVDAPWIEPLGARLQLGVTVISWPFALMTAFIAILCCLWLAVEDTSPALVGLVLVISAASLGVFSSLDALLLFVFFELALIPMWFVIAYWGSGGARRAATRFLLFTVAGSALLLVGIVIASVHGGSLEIINLRTTTAAVVLITLGFAVKTPLVPLHTWLPDAHSAAPTVGSVLLAAVFLKLGTYGLLVLVAPSDHIDVVAPYLAIAGAFGIVWSGFACYAQDDLKRLIAYSSIGHMGFVVLAISTRSDTGLAAAVFGSVAHGLVTGLLFFTAGSLKDRFGTASIAGIGRGLYARTPWLAVTFVLAAVASLGLPGLAGFWGELLSLRAAYEVGEVLSKPVAWTGLGLALLGIALTTAYFVRAIRLVAQGEPEPQEADRDLGRREVVVMGVLVVAVIVLGLAPQLLLDLYEPVHISVAR